MDEIKNVLGKWWLVLILGVVALVIGIWMVCSPGKTFMAMSTLLMILFLAMGIGEIVYVIANRKCIPAYGWNLAAAIIIFLLGVGVAVRPFGSEFLLAFLFAFGIFFYGLKGLTNAFTLKAADYKGWWVTLIIGIITTLFGCSLMFHPFFSAAVYGILLGIGIISGSVNLIVTALMMSKAKSVIDKATA